MEEVNDLIPGKLQIIQDTDYFKFGTDSVLLANFVKVKDGESVVDLGSGSGVIPLLLAFKQKPGRVIGLEILPELVQLSKKSARMNGLEEIIEFIEGDIKEIDDYIELESVDLVVCNPPYMPPDKGKITKNREKAIARHEILITLKDVIKQGSRVLRLGGKDGHGSQDLAFAGNYNPDEGK